MTDPNRYRDPLSGEAQADLDAQLPFSGMPNADGVAVPQQEQKENSDIKALHHAEAQMYDEQQAQDSSADQLAAMRRASSITPEYAAYCDKLSADLDVPFNAVAHDKEAARKEADVPAWQQIARFAPKTSALLQEKPEVFHQVQDDAAALKDLEVFKSELKKNGVTDDEYNAATKTIFDPAESIKAELNKSLETGTPYVMPSRQNSAFFTNLDALGTQFNESAIQSADIGMRLLFNDMQESLGVISHDEALENRDNLTREYKDSALRSSEATPNFSNSLLPKSSEFMFGAASSFAQSAPLMFGGVALKLAGVPLKIASALTLSGMFGQQFLLAYPKYRSRGGDVGESALGSMLEGSFEVAFEKSPLGFAMEELGKMSVKNFAKYFASKDAIGEQGATFFQDLTDTLIANQNKTMAEFWQERPEAAVQTMFAVGMNTAAMASIQHIANTVMKYDGSYEANQKLNQEMEIVKKLKVAGLNTVRAKQIIDNMDGDSPQDVYVDPQQLFNQGEISPQQFKNAMPNYSAQLDEALAVGGLLRMNKNELMLAMRNDEEGWASLSQHLKVDPAADSLYESAQSRDALTDELNKLADKRIAESKNEAEARDNWDALKEKARQRLADSGMDKEAIEQAATMDASVAHAFSTRTGLDAGDILSGQFGTVSRRLSGGEILGGAFNQSRQDELDEIDFFESTGIYSKDEAATLRAKLQKEGDRDESRYDENGYRITARDEAGAYLSHFPATTEIHGEESAGVRRIRQSSDRITNELRRAEGKPQEVHRTVPDRPLGPFSSYVVNAKTYDHPTDPKQGQLEIRYYGKEQMDAGLTGEPALTVIIGKDGEFGINGPSPESETFKAFKERGWAEEAKQKDGVINKEHTRLINPHRDDGQFSPSQVKDILADAHARLRAWRKEDRVGLNWGRATGATGGEFGNEGAAFFQNDTSPRGFFDPKTRDITLLPKSDLSTYLHESGHLYLEVMASLAGHETASEGLRADMDAALKWFGVKGENASERLAAWNAMTLEEKRNFHEKWAESFEQYLFEGVAPSPELREAFKNFRQWLTHVYKSMAQFLVGQKNAKLNDEMRGVFDRILASEEQINTMREARNMLPLFTVKPANITADEWERYEKAAKDFAENSIEQLTSRSLRDMKWLSNAKNKTLRKLQMEAAQARREARMEARTAVLGQPVYRAWQFLTAPVEGVVARNKQARSSEHVDTARDSLFTAIAKLGGLNKEEAVSQYGIDPKDFLRKGGVFGKPVLRVDGGLSPDAMAEALSQFNYLPLDEHGKWDILDLEDLLREEAAGNPQYSTDVDMDVLLGEPQRAFFDAENVEYMGGRLNRIDIRNMFDDIQLAEMAGIDPFTGEKVADMSGQLQQPAFHGSPYKFDKFSLEHIGKGEGAQAYGWGLYFAGNKEVAEYYRETLAIGKGGNNFRQMAVDALAAEGVSVDDDSALTVFQRFAMEMTGKGGKPASYARKVQNASAPMRAYDTAAIGRALQTYVEAENKGQLYKVEIPEDDTYLLWDKPLIAQSEKVKAALRSMDNRVTFGKDRESVKQWIKITGDIPPEMRAMTGGALYSHIAGKLNARHDSPKTGSQQASEYLHSIGIRGIKYLDGSSRGAGDGNYNYVIFDDSAVKILETYYQLGDKDQPQSRNKKNKDTDLFVAHNLSEENLIHADELGGLAAPSLGVSRTTTGGFDGFGGITLLADKEILTDRYARTFDADVYSPRHPRAQENISYGNYIDLVQRIKENQGEVQGLEFRVDHDSLMRNGANDLANSEAFQNYYLVSKGIIIKPKKAKAAPAILNAIKYLKKNAKHDSAYAAYNLRDEDWFKSLAEEHYKAEFEKWKNLRDDFTPAELVKYGPFEEDGSLKYYLYNELALVVENYHKKGGQDSAATRGAIAKHFRTDKGSAELQEFARAELAKISSGKQLVKYTKNGNQKRSAYTLENIVDEMTRELRGGEGFNYGAGSVRSAFAFEFKHNTIESIKSFKKNIVSKQEMDKVRDDANNKLSEALDRLAKFYKYDSTSWGYTNDASSAIAEGPKGWSSAFKMTTESKKIITDLVTYLRNLPSEYFETKMQRAVGIGEFKTAVVPKGISAKAMAILEKNGLNVVTYDPKKEGSRTAVIAKQEDILFQKKGKDSKPKNRTLESMGVLSDDGIHPDAVADFFGFPSTEAMIKSLLTAPDPLSEINRLTDEIMVQRHADLATPQAIEQAALAALHSEAHSKFLATELAILNRAVGKPRFVMQAAKQYADRIVSALRIADLNPAQYEMQAAKAGKETEKLLGQNKTADAAMAKRNQILHDATARRVREEKESVAKALRFFDRTEKAARNGKLRADVGAQVLTLLDTYDLRKGTTLKAAELADRSLAEFVQQQSEAMDMPMPSLADAVLRGGVKRSYKTMSVEEFNGLVDAVKYLEAVGRREYAMYKAVRDQSFAQERSAILDRLREYWPDAFDEEGNPLPTENAILKTAGYNTKKKARSAVHELLTPETVTNILEGGEFGQVHDSLFARLSNAMTDRSILMKELHEKLQPFMDAYTWKERREFGKKDIGTAAIGEPLSRENALVAALLAGSKEGRDRLANYGWNDARIAQVVNLLDAKDIALANAIFDMFDNTLWPKLESLNKRTMGVSPPKVLPIALQAKNGTLTGGYFPIRYDGDMDARSSSFDDKQALDLMKNGIGLSAKTNQSSSQARVDGVKMRPLLSLSVMSKVAGETAHDIALREAVMDSARLLNNAEIAQGIQNIVGMEGWKSLKKNLGDIASPPHEAGGMFASAANFARRNVVTALMSGVGTAVQNFTGLLPAFSRVHKGLLLKEIADVPHLIEKYKDTIEKSAYMRERFGRFERDLVNDVDKLGMKKGLMPDQSVWFAMMAWVDRAVSVPVWQAAYREGVAKGVDAVEYADHIVRQTQGGGRLIDRAPIMRGGALQQLFTMFYSYFNGQLNMVARDAALAKREVAQGEVSKAAARLAASAIFVWILPAVVSELTRQAPDDEDDEEKLQRVVRATILYPTAMIPLLRDFAPFVYDKIAGNRAFDPRLTPVQGFVSTLSRAATAAGDIGSDDFDEKDFKALMMGVGFTFNLPAILFTDVVLGTKALLNGETDDIRAPLIGTAPSR